MTFHVIAVVFIKTPCFTILFYVMLTIIYFTENKIENKYNTIF